MTIADWRTFYHLITSDNTMRNLITIFRMFQRVEITAILTGLLTTQMLVGQDIPVFPDDWIYQKAVTISGTGTSLSDYQVKITLSGGTGGNFEFSKAQNNGGDIRFLDEDRTTQLPYWIESWIFPSSATIWVKVPDIPAEGKEIYLCYGIPMYFDEFNPDIVESTSSGDNTFLFFDDFSQPQLDPLKWGIAGSPNISIIDGIASITDEGGLENYIQSLLSFSDFVLEVKVNMTVDANNNCTPAIGFRVEDFHNPGDFVDRYITTLRGEDLTGGGGPGNDLLISRYQEGAETNPTQSSSGYNYEANLYYNFKLVANGTNIIVYLDDVSVASWNDTGSEVTDGGISLANYGGLVSNPVYFDNVRIRALSPIEPVTSLNSENKVWIDATGFHDWNLAMSWSPIGVPTFMDNVRIPYINTRKHPKITGDRFRNYEYTECLNLTIDAGVTLTLDHTGDLTINGDLTNNGIIKSESSQPIDGGSLIVRGTAMGTGAVAFDRYLRTESNYGDRHFISSPVDGQALTDFITANGARIENDALGYHIWRYQETDGTWSIVSSDLFDSGHGYNIDQAVGSGGLMIFSGSVVSATESNPLTVTATSPYSLSYDDRYALDPINPDPYGVSNHDADIWAPGRSWTVYGGGGWNLLGNPFTSCMDAAAFISLNYDNFDPFYRALYLYDGVNDVYKYAASIVPGWEDPIQMEDGYWNINNDGNYSDLIHTCQGFFVLAQYSGVTFTFTQSMQRHGHMHHYLLKSASAREPWPGLKLQVKFGDRMSSTVVVYNDSMTIGLDEGYDVGQLSSNPDVEIYTSLVQMDNSVNFSRQALPPIDFDKNVIPVGIDTERGGQVTFSADIVPLDNCRFWLEDRLTGTFTELNDDTYTVTLSPNTYGTGRFFILASANTPVSSDTPQVKDAGVRIWTAYDMIIIQGDVGNGAICEVYNLNGQTILRSMLNDAYLNTISLSTVPDGIYIIRVVDDAKITTRKVAVHNE